MDKDTLDIHSRSGYPSGQLSNFAEHHFEIDGVPCHSMEGFLQALTHKDIEEQKKICLLHGYKAKQKANKYWKKDQTLHWQGKEYPRRSREYQQLLDRAYAELGKNEKFAEALLATGNMKLTHHVGRSTKSETILTKGEFCSKLMELRKTLQKPTLF